ncbi:MAG: hypothetical protein OXR66_03400 [Candidatus Woesearchaeota archaeon]|nr:hypothetical protein [Candidatus Woesearchaeota archaeon]
MASATTEKQDIKLALIQDYVSLNGLSSVIPVTEEASLDAGMQSSVKALRVLREQ